MPIVDTMDAPSAGAGTLAGVADDMGASEPGLDAVIVDVDTQSLADQPRGRAVEDAVHEEAAGAGDTGDDLGEVSGATGG